MTGSLSGYCTLVPDICNAGKTVRAIPGSADAYHLDAVALGEFIKDLSVKVGVNHIADIMNNIVQNESGSIRELELESGKTVQRGL